MTHPLSHPTIRRATILLRNLTDIFTLEISQPFPVSHTSKEVSQSCQLTRKQQAGRYTTAHASIELRLGEQSSLNCSYLHNIISIGFNSIWNT